MGIEEGKPIAETARKMNVEERADIAERLFRDGAACSQAVACAYADVLGVDEKTLARAMLGFGGGFGRLREVCGAVSGMTALLGLALSDGDVSDAGAKKRVYAAVQEAIGEFKAENGSCICRELLGEEGSRPASSTPDARTADYYKRRPCAAKVRSAARIAGDALAEILSKKGSAEQ